MPTGRAFGTALPSSPQCCKKEIKGNYGATQQVPNEPLPKSLHEPQKGHSGCWIKSWGATLGKPTVYSSVIWDFSSWEPTSNSSSTTANALWEGSSWVKAETGNLSNTQKKSFKGRELSGSKTPRLTDVSIYVSLSAELCIGLSAK